MGHIAAGNFNTVTLQSWRSRFIANDNQKKKKASSSSSVQKDAEIQKQQEKKDEIDPSEHQLNLEEEFL